MTKNQLNRKEAEISMKKRKAPQVQKETKKNLEENLTSKNKLKENFEAIIEWGVYELDLDEKREVYNLFEEYLQDPENFPWEDFLETLSEYVPWLEVFEEKTKEGWNPWKIILGRTQKMIKASIEEEEIELWEERLSNYHNATSFG